VAADIIPEFAPAWADVFGEDRSGIFAEFAYRDARFVLRWIPPGQFLMGSPEGDAGRDADEGPAHEVTISQGFWLGETMVTQQQWEAVTNTTPSHFRGKSRPVEKVSWEDGVGFFETLRKAIPELNAGFPTEAQWEYACRAGTTGAYCVDGSEASTKERSDPVLNELGWYHANSAGETHDVGLKMPNNWGLYDMHGNVWEWCLDGMREYAAAREVDPVGPRAGAHRVVRGGSWSGGARFCRAAFRVRLVPGDRDGSLGLRLFAGQEPRAAEPPGAERPEAVDR